MAAKHNALEAIEKVVGKGVFGQEMIEKDYKGDSPVHTAAKCGSGAVLRYYLENGSGRFVEMKNDFGLTALEAVRAKIKYMEDNEGEEGEEAW